MSAQRYLGAFVACALMAVACASLRAQPAEARRLLGEATELFGHGGNPTKTNQAVAKLHEALRLSPDFYEAQVQLARCHRSLGQFDQAFAVCDAAVRLQPAKPTAYETLADVRIAYASLHPEEGPANLESAMKAYREALRLAPGSVANWLKLSILLRTRLGRREEATTACREALALAPRSPEAWYELGECLMPDASPRAPADPEAYSAAVAAYGDAIRLKSDYAQAYIARAGALYLARKDAAAVATLRQGIDACRGVKKDHPKLDDLFLALGRLRLATGDRAAAQAVNKVLRAADPDSSRQLSALIAADAARTAADSHPEGGVFMVGADASGQNTLRRIESAADARAAVAQSGSHTLVFRGDPAVEAYNAALALEAAGNRAAAIAAYREAIQSRPDFAEAHHNLGNICFKLGRREEALACFRECVRVKPGYAPGHYSIGLWFELNSQLPEALESYREAVRLAPANAAMQHKLGNIHAFLGRFEEAIGCYEACVAADSRFAAGWMALGVMRLHVGNRPEAIRVQATLQPLDANMAGQLQSLIDGKARLQGMPER